SEIPFTRKKLGLSQYHDQRLHGIIGSDNLAGKSRASVDRRLIIWTCDLPFYWEFLPLRCARRASIRKCPPRCRRRPAPSSRVRRCVTSRCWWERARRQSRDRSQRSTILDGCARALSQIL